MAPSTRSNPALMRKIATLWLTLAPFVPLPYGPPHPAFPKTLFAFHLLTEDELDALAHYYHQSTPGPWTLQYPTTMNWDKEFLAKPQRRLSVQELTDIVKMVNELNIPRRHSVSQYKTLSDSDRVRIKRRKVGKFIGLVGMETPAEEIVGRLEASLDRALEKSRAEQQRIEELLGWKKMF